MCIPSVSQIGAFVPYADIGSSPAIISPSVFFSTMCFAFLFSFRASHDTNTTGALHASIFFSLLPVNSLHVWPEGHFIDCSWAGLHEVRVEFSTCFVLVFTNRVSEFQIRAA